MNTLPVAPTVTEYLYRKATAAGVPFSGTFELTPVCNMDCKMCYVRMSRSAQEAIAPLKDAAQWLTLAQAAKDAGIACQRSVCPSSTGTNATTVNLTGKGVPTVDVGLPLYSMHTYNEVLSLFDANELARLIEVFVCDTEIAEVFAE